MKLVLSLALFAALSTQCFADSVKMSIHAKVNFTTDQSNPNRYNFSTADIDVSIQGKVDGEQVSQSQSKHMTAEESDVQYLLVGNNEITSVGKDGSQEVTEAKVTDNSVEFSGNQFVKAAGDGASASVKASKAKCTRSDSAMTCSISAEMKIKTQ